MPKPKLGRIETTAECCICGHEYNLHVSRDITLGQLEEYKCPECRLTGADPGYVWKDDPGRYLEYEVYHEEEIKTKVEDKTKNKKTYCILFRKEYECGIGIKEPIKFEKCLEVFNGNSISAAPELYEALKAVEWSGRDDYGNSICPTCRLWIGHAKDCKLNAVLKKVTRVL